MSTPSLAPPSLPHGECRAGAPAKRGTEHGSSGTSTLRTCCHVLNTTDDIIDIIDTIDTIDAERREELRPLLVASDRQHAQVTPECYGRHRHLTWHMRSALLAWVWRTAKELALDAELVFIAAHLIDAFLSQTRLTVTRPLFQLVGATAALVAFKVCHADQSALSPWRLARLSRGNFEPHDLLRMERLLLRELHYDTLVVTPLAFLPDLLPTGQRRREEFRELCVEVATLSLFCEAHLLTPPLARAALAVRKAHEVVCDARAAGAFAAALEALRARTPVAEHRLAKAAAALFGVCSTACPYTRT